MKIKRLISILASAVVIACAAPSIAAPAAQPTSDASIGIVDVDKVLGEFNKKKAADNEVKALVKSLQDKLEIRGRHKLLNETELSELETLRAKAKPTEKEKARITELEDLEKNRDNELLELQNKRNPSETDKTRLRALLSQNKQSEETLVKLSKEYSTQVRQQSSDKSKALTTEILDTIKKVAEQKGISAVFDKKALLYGGVDLTTSVLNVLNKK